MPHTRNLSDQELIDISHHWRRAALGGSSEALFEAKRHETELRRRFGEIDLSTLETAPKPSCNARTHPTEVATLPEALEKFVVATADASTKSGEALQDLLFNLRTILQMDIAFVAEFVDGNKVYRSLDYAQGSPVTVSPGESVPLETTLCQRVVDGRSPQIMNDTRADPRVADLAAVKKLDIGAYLSTPVFMRDGSVYGTICCISHQARSALGTRQLDSLRYVAGIIAAELEKRRGSPLREL